MDHGWPRTGASPCSMVPLARCRVCKNSQTPPPETTRWTRDAPCAPIGYPTTSRPCIHDNDVDPPTAPPSPLTRARSPHVCTLWQQLAALCTTKSQSRAADIAIAFAHGHLPPTTIQSTKLAVTLTPHTRGSSCLVSLASFVGCPQTIRIPLSACFRFGRWPSIDFASLHLLMAHCGAEHVPDCCSLNCCPACEPLFLQRHTSRGDKSAYICVAYTLLVDWNVVEPANLSMQGKPAETHCQEGALGAFT
jgi:hypothetical protein